MSDAGTEDRAPAPPPEPGDELTATIGAVLAEQLNRITGLYQELASLRSRPAVPPPPTLDPPSAPGSTDL